MELLAHSEELWVMGKEISEGMKGEIEFAAKQGIPTFYMRQPSSPQYYPISRDGNGLLSENGCIPNSCKKDYEGQWLILRHEILAAEHRTLLNQLWLCTHGPGCAPVHHFSDTIHLLHPVDQDYLAIARGEVWGIAKPETLECLTARYPRLGENLTALQPATEPGEDISR